MAESNLEEENKILREMMKMILREKGLELSERTRQRLCHFAKAMDIPKENVLKLAEELSMDFVKEVFSTKAGH